MQLILEAKIILTVMAHKIIWYFNQCTSIFKKLVVLKILRIDNLKDYIMKKLVLLPHLIIIIKLLQI